MTDVTSPSAIELWEERVEAAGPKVPRRSTGTPYRQELEKGFKASRRYRLLGEVVDELTRGG